MSEQRITSRSPVTTSMVIVHLIVSVTLFAVAVLLSGCGA